MTGKHLAVLNGNVLISNYAVKVNVITRVSILQKNGILNYSSLTYLYASEEDGVFNNALDNASVRDNGGYL